MHRSHSLLLTALLAACGVEPSSTTAEASEALRHERAELTVMTRNLYIGADILRVVNAQGAAEVALAVSETFAMVQATDFPARARLIAGEIEQTRPDVIGLQEVATWRTGPGAACTGDLTPQATDVAYDFLEILRHALRHRGLRYDLAAEITTLDIELCDATLQDLRYTDRDVVLVRHGLPSRGAASATFQTAAVFPVVLDPGSNPPVVVEIPVKSGWTAVEVQKGRRWFRVFETHLADLVPVDPPYVIQLAQAGELVATIGGMAQQQPLPTILVGDFNAAADPEFHQATYAFLAGGQPFPDLGIPDLEPLLGLTSPFQDSWLALRHGRPGFTWGFDEDLRGGTFTQRLDLTLGWGVKPLATGRTGLRGLTCSGLHASDHAGVVTTFAAR